jgi:hypothetical protein
MEKRKRIVSHPEYLAYLARKTTLRSGMFASGIGFYTCLMLTILCVLGSIICLCTAKDSMGFFLLGAGILGETTYALFLATMFAKEKAESLEPVTPLTRQNIEHLPAEETLVRASREPTEGQEKVLLRAATATDETAAEELLRASQ